MRPGLSQLGGDEFVVIVCTSDRETVSHIAERMLTAMAQPIGNVSLTMSIGIASGALDNLREAFAASDLALYGAKHAGKNCSVWADAATL